MKNKTKYNTDLIIAEQRFAITLLRYYAITLLRYYAITLLRYYGRNVVAELIVSNYSTIYTQLQLVKLMRKQPINIREFPEEPRKQLMRLFKALRAKCIASRYAL